MAEIIKKLETRHKLALFAAAVVAVSYAFYAFIYTPQLEQRGILANELLARRQQVDLIEAFSLAHPDADQYLREVDSQRLQADQMLPDQAELPDFLMQLERTAVGNGVKLLQLTPAPFVNKEGYYEIPIEMTIRGNFYQTANFFRKLEEGPRFTNPTQVLIQSKNGELTSKVTVTIYSFGAAPQKSPGDANPGSASPAPGNAAPVRKE